MLSDWADTIGGAYFGMNAPPNRSSRAAHPKEDGRRKNCHGGPVSAPLTNETSSSIVGCVHLEKIRLGNVLYR